MGDHPKQTAAAILLALIFFSCGGGPTPEIEALSSRPDMVTGGDVLIEIRGVSADALEVRLNGQDVSAAFGPRGDSGALVGLLSGLELGANQLEASAGGETARLELVNHPRTGPVFSGPHQQPFLCETEAAGLGAPLDENCSAATQTNLYYRSTEPADEDQPHSFQPYDPAGPRPADMAQTTTTAGRTVDFIVRLETGTINRAIYQFASLFDPSQAASGPSQPNQAWNGRLVYRFGGGCRAGYRQARMPSLLTAVDLLGQGFAVAGSSLNIFGNNCNDVLSAETMMMVKERFIETYGPPVHTIGTGGSGGSMQQHLIAQNYPGLLDGIIPGASYPDIVTLIGPVTDCSLLNRAFADGKQAWSDEQKTAVSGYATWKTCESWMRSFSPAWLEPESCAVESGEDVRCGLHDNMVNLVGRDPQTGQARRILDNIGVEYGRKAFEDGRISAEQFVELNETIGGYDGDAHFVAQRTAADPEALEAVYRGGRVNAGGGALGSIPILDTRRYLDPTGDIHDRVRTFLLAQRLEKANGGSDNRVILTNAPKEVDAVVLMDKWFDAIAQDEAEGEPVEVIARNRPKELESACWSEDGERIADDVRGDPEGRCSELFPPHSDPRLVAGASAGGDVLKCTLEPLSADRYRQPLSEQQLQRLQAVFPDGVCDYSQPGVGQQPPAGAWQRY